MFHKTWIKELNNTIILTFIKFILNEKYLNRSIVLCYLPRHIKDTKYTQKYLCPSHLTL